MNPMEKDEVVVPGEDDSLVDGVLPDDLEMSKKIVECYQGQD